MRLPVVLSVALHFAVLTGLAMTVPAARPPRATNPIEIEVNRARANAEVKPVTPPLALPEPLKREPRVAMRTVQPRERERPEDDPKKHEEPEKKSEPVETTHPTETQPPEASSLSPRAAGRVDLTLHSLPTIGSGGGEIAVPSGTGGIGGTGTGGAPGARKPWKPKLDAGDPITGKVAEEKKEDFPLIPLGRDGFAYKGPQFSAHILSDGSVAFDDKIVRDFKGLSGTFDVADLVMKSKKEDPYRHEKKKFLAATAELREKMAKQARAEEMASSLSQLPTHLLAIWADRGRSAHERRELLFRIWREAATTEDDRSAGGAEARKIIEGFIRDRLPQGSPDGYTDDELEGYNRTGHVRFDPYH
ncbi:MAG TPA: hypothetical protein VFF06_25050 [Polyangia bacterium]|nr:hypothetical protein [Polyangia bacterium]